MFKGTGTLAAGGILAHRRAQRRPRQRLHRLRRHRLSPDHRRRPARAGHAHGSRPHGQPAHPREGADARAPGRARGASHAGRQRAGRACSTRPCASSSSAAAGPTACRSVGYVEEVKKLDVRRSRDLLPEALRAQQRRADRGGRHQRPMRSPSSPSDTMARLPRGRSRRAGGRRWRRHRPAAAGDPRRCAGCRAALGARLSRRLSYRHRRRRSMPMRFRCWRAARRQRDQPPVARAGGRRASRPVGRRRTTARRASA